MNLGIPPLAIRSIHAASVFLLAALSTPCLTLAETTTYEYDALGRLIQVTKDDGTVVDYDYDAAGNRKNKETSIGGSGGGGEPTNNPPAAANDSVLINIEVGVRILNLTANDSDPDGDTLTVTSVTQPSNSNVVILSGGDVRIFAETRGLDAFVYTVSDGNGGTDTGVVTVNVWGRTGGVLR